MDKLRIKRIAAYAAMINFVLSFGKIGSLDCGANWEEALPGLILYLIALLISAILWNGCNTRH